MPRRPRDQNGGEEFRFRFDAYNPTKIPMLRLAEYMHELAKMFGEQNAVHFRRLLRGSTIISAVVEHEALPKVRERVSDVRRGGGPSDAKEAYRTLNKFLRDDNAVAVLKERNAVVLPFPGRNEVREKFDVVRQQGSVEGIISTVGGKDQTAHITLQIEDNQVSGFIATRTLAKQLAKQLYEPVRLFGRGRWSRDQEGVWTLIDFRVESFEPVQQGKLSDALAALRAIPTEWTDTAYEELSEIRHGPRGRTNGGH
jgi:hypothetical protein